MSVNSLLQESNLTNAQYLNLYCNSITANNVSVNSAYGSMSWKTMFPGEGSNITIAQTPTWSNASVAGGFVTFNNNLFNGIQSSNPGGGTLYQLEPLVTGNYLINGYVSILAQNASDEILLELSINGSNIDLNSPRSYLVQNQVTTIPFTLVLPLDAGSPVGFVASLKSGSQTVNIPSFSMSITQLL